MQSPCRCREGQWASGKLVLAISFAVGLTPGAPAQPPMAPPDAVVLAEEDAAMAPPADAATPGKEKEAPKCTAEKCEQLERAVATAYRGLFYENDFSYLDDECYCDWHLGEMLKQMDLGCCGTVDLGGEYRARYQSEHNMRGLLFLGRDDHFLLHRTRLYANVRLDEDIRGYVEYLDAVSNYEEFAPRAIEENRSDLLNAFLDLRLLDDDRLGQFTVRTGRQELLYGEQRLISPLDWANTRRTFDGARGIWQRDEWRVDGFWTRPVLIDPRNFDEGDQNQEFYALWATHKEGDDRTVDLYWIGYHDYDSPYREGRSFKIQTCGSRWHQRREAWQTLLQGGFQFGEFGEFDHAAGFYVAGVAHTWEDREWKPTLWLYFDWASGDEVQGNGFQQLFPLGHKYLGFMDFFARSNIQDLNAQWTAQPCDNLSLLAWWHCFWLEDADDVPYTVVGLPYVPVAGGSRYLGQEIDLLATWKPRPHTEVVLGYSHFFTGEWFRTNPIASAGATGADADFVYLQFAQQF